MLLSDLARTLDQLAGAGSRRGAVELVADLLKRAARDEHAPVVYLLQAQLRPPYEGVEVGLGEKLLVAAIAAAYGKSEAVVDRAMRGKGDLGTVAEKFAPATKRKSLTVHDAYAALLAVAETGGSGSVERKVARFAELLRKAAPVEAKLLVRVAQGRLRLGLGDQSILEAAALAALGDRRAKGLLEHAYNVRSDLGEVVALAFAKGQRALEGIGPEIGVPVRPALAQRLASAEEIVRRLGAVQLEPKFDGLRLQLHRDGKNVTIFSRRLENVTGMFPELVEGLLRQLKQKRAILEGEAVVYDTATGAFLPFQVTMTRKRKTNIEAMSKSHPLRLFAFDVLQLGNVNLIPKTQEERSRRLREAIRFEPGDPVEVTATIVASRPEQVDAFFADSMEKGYEGLIAKRRDAPYQPGARGYHWVKLKRAYSSKLRDTVDLVLVGYIRGRGKRAAFGIGSLLGAVYDEKNDRFRTVAKIGSGLTDAAWREMRKRLDAASSAKRPARVESLITPDVWVEPKYVVEVLADEITRSPFHTAGKTGDEPGYALRFPRMTAGVRSDKGPTDATTEREIVQMFRAQGKR